MGTLWEVRLYHDDAALARRAATEALNEIARVERLLSVHDPASELSRLNREAGRGPVVVSPELFVFLRRCREYVQATGGTFDPAVGPLVRAWGFLDGHPVVPSPDAVAEARARSGWGHITLNDARLEVSVDVPGVEIDPGGIGKGYAVDRAVAVLTSAGVRAALVSAGGSTVAAIGGPPGRAAWTVAIASPVDPDRPLATVALHDAALSTSGTLYRAVQVGTRRYGHIIDPRTGQPADGVCQATVVAPGATESEALTKAALLLGRDELQARLRPRPGVHALRLEGPCRSDAVVWHTPWSSAVFVRPLP